MSQGKLRLGAHGLTPSEIVLIQMLLRLSAYNRDVNWIYAAEPPYDAILLHDPDGHADLGNVDAETPYVLRLTRINAGSAPGTMERPIRSEKLFRWLDHVERDLNGHEPSDAVPPVSPSKTAGKDEASKGTTARASLQAFSATASRQTMAQDLSSEAPRLRLRRWPPASVVRDNSERVRMATLLARRALNAHDLHRLTGLDATECLVFMKLLRASDLLMPPPVTEEQRRAGDEKSAAALQKNTGLHQGLARRLTRGLRKRLGLWAAGSQA